MDTSNSAQTNLHCSPVAGIKPKSIPVSGQVSAFTQQQQCREYVKANFINRQLLEFLPEGDAAAAEAEALWTCM